MVDGSFEHCAKGQAEYCQATATPLPPSCPVTIYPLPKNALPLEQAVAQTQSQQKIQRAAARDHGLNRVTLGEACKRASYMLANNRRLQLVRCL